MITMQCTATQNLRKEYLKSNCEEKKNSCSRITMASNIQVLRKEMSTILRDINTYLIEMLHNLKIMAQNFRPSPNFSAKALRPFATLKTSIIQSGLITDSSQNSALHALWSLYEDILILKTFAQFSSGKIS